MGGAAKTVTNAVTDTVKAAGDVLQGGVNAVKDVGGGAVDAVKDTAKGIDWTGIRDTAETAAVLAGNTFVPGSSMLTQKLVSDGSQEQLNSTLGKVAQVGTSIAGVSSMGATGDPSSVPVEDATVSSVGGGSTTAATTSTTSAAASTGSTAAAASSGPPVVDLSFSPVAPQTMSVAEVGSGGISALELGGYAAGSYAVGNALDRKMEQMQNPDGGTAASASTTTPLVDNTKGETRASAADIANVLNFQDQASTRRRMSGAAALAPTSQGSANVGSKALLGA